jgi:ribosome biogenesis GTPase
VNQLDRLGYRPFFATQMARLSNSSVPGRVIAQHRRQWEVATETGIVRAVLAGRLWANQDVRQTDDAQPVVGDWVAVERSTDDDSTVIVAVLDRQTSMVRTSMARKGARQTIVANVDRVAVVVAFSQGEASDHVARRSLHPRRIERYVAAISHGGAQPLVLINKADLSSDSKRSAEELQTRLKGCPVLTVSCRAPGGMDDFESRLASGETVGLVGLSGVGKSSIVNLLLKRSAQEVGAERSSDARGRHTTTHRELFVAPSGVLLIDTPGMREFALEESASVDLGAFEDIVASAEHCQFRNCAHRDEPGCAVNRAVAAGQIDKDRLHNFLALKDQGQKTPFPTKRPLTRRHKKYPSRASRSARKMTEDE